MMDIALAYLLPAITMQKKALLASNISLKKRISIHMAEVVITNYPLPFC
jgi:hypothetical protein